MGPHVISGIVRDDLCIGCGLCAALCPQHILEIVWNQYGEYNSIEVVPCSTQCGVCLSVCPFADGDINEDEIGRKLYGNVPGINRRPETGYYLSSYVGYSDKHRPSSASGGIATWILEKLLEENIVDMVICVAPNADQNKLFTFKIFNTSEGLLNGSGSAYYPVEMSDVIKRILEVPGRYAVTGLPCFIKAIRLAQLLNKELQSRILVTIGLVCGQMKSKHFTDYIASLSGLERPVAAVRYRMKSPIHPAYNFYFAFTSIGGDEKIIFSRKGISEAWTNRWFTPNACNYCDDVFAECADVACMDAWLPEYSRDSRGTSLILVRSPMIRELIDKEKDCDLSQIHIDQLIYSQAGVLAVKRRHLAYRLALDLKRGKRVPKKRVAPEQLKSLLIWKEVVIMEEMADVSKKLWDCKNRDAKQLREAMNPLMTQLIISREIANAFTFPVRTLRYIRKKFYGDQGSI